MATNISKKKAIELYLATLEGSMETVDAIEFEMSLQDWADNNGYFIGSYNRSVRENKLENSIDYTIKLMQQDEIKGMQLIGEDTYLLTGYDSQLKQAKQANQVKQVNLSKYTKQANNKKSLSSQSNKSSVLTPVWTLNIIIQIIALLIGFRIVKGLITGNISFSSPQLWALPIALITTKLAIFNESSDMNILGRIFITIVVWLAALYFYI